MAGIDFVRQVQNDDPAVPIILFTSAEGMKRVQEQATELRLYGLTVTNGELLRLLDRLVEDETPPLARAAPA
jgi:two-component SAPR family response regulator